MGGMYGWMMVGGSSGNGCKISEDWVEFNVKHIFTRWRSFSSFN